MAGESAPCCSPWTQRCRISCEPGLDPAETAGIGVTSGRREAPVGADQPHLAGQHHHVMAVPAGQRDPPERTVTAGVGQPGRLGDPGDGSVPGRSDSHQLQAPGRQGKLEHAQRGRCAWPCRGGPRREHRDPVGGRVAQRPQQLTVVGGHRAAFAPPPEPGRGNGRHRSPAPALSQGDFAHTPGIRPPLTGESSWTAGKAEPCRHRRSSLRRASKPVGWRLGRYLGLRLPVRRLQGSQRGQERQATSATRYERRVFDDRARKPPRS